MNWKLVAKGHHNLIADNGEVVATVTKDAADAGRGVRGGTHWKLTVRGVEDTRKFFTLGVAKSLAERSV